MKVNKDSFRKILKEFSLILKGWGLIDGKLVVIDGTKLKASNSRKNYLNIETLTRKIEYIDSKINEYMISIENTNVTIDAIDQINLTNNIDELKNKLEEYKNRKQEFEKIKTYMKEKSLKQISFTVPDSRGMKSNGKSEICFNVQSAVDSKNSLIIECDVVNDLNQLSNMALRVKKTLRKRKLGVVADTDYYNAEEIKICVDKKISCT